MGGLLGLQWEHWLPTLLSTRHDPSSTVEELVQPPRYSAQDPAGSHGIPPHRVQPAVPWAQGCPWAMTPLPLFSPARVGFPLLPLFRG